MNFPYLLGLLETDGSFHILFKADPRMKLKYRIQPEIQWSQKEIKLLFALQECLQTLGIVSKFKNFLSNERSGRAPVVKIEGIASCRAFINAVDGWSAKNGFIPLSGVKYLDFMLMKELLRLIAEGLHNTPEGRHDVLDLKYALHNPPSQLGELNHLFFKGFTPQWHPPAGLFPRSLWEKRFGIPPSPGKGDLVERVQGEYLTYVKLLIRGKGTLSPDYVSGVINGDGSLYIGKGGRPVLSITLEQGSEALFFAISKYFQDVKPVFHKYKERNASQYCIARKETLPHVCNHLERYPVIFKGNRNALFLDCCVKRGIWVPKGEHH